MKCCKKKKKKYFYHKSVFYSSYFTPSTEGFVFQVLAFIILSFWLSTKNTKNHNIFILLKTKRKTIIKCVCVCIKGKDCLFLSLTHSLLQKGHQSSRAITSSITVFPLLFIYIIFFTIQISIIFFNKNFPLSSLFYYFFLLFG